MHKRPPHAPVGDGHPLTGSVLTRAVEMAGRTPDLAILTVPRWRAWKSLVEKPWKSLWKSSHHLGGAASPAGVHTSDRVRVHTLHGVTNQWGIQAIMTCSRLLESSGV